MLQYKLRLEKDTTRENRLKIPKIHDNDLLVSQNIQYLPFEY